MERYDVAVIGAGPAGIGAAVSAKMNGAERVCVIERGDRLGGILPQCLHYGFGLRKFGTEMTGAEYAERIITEFDACGAEIMLNTAVIAADNSILTCASPERGIMQIEAKSVIIASGCRERPCGSLNVCGSRPSGVFTAGLAQRMVNLEHRCIGRKIAVLGSGDIGIIMAHTLHSAGCEIVFIAEMADSCGALPVNQERYLIGTGIPVLYNHTITELHGKSRLTGVTVCPVGNDGTTIHDKAVFYECDTLMTSVGLIPETELMRDAGAEILGSHVLRSDNGQTSLDWLFVCGNAHYVHDFADDVYEDGMHTGRCAAEFAKGQLKTSGSLLPPPAKVRRDSHMTCTGCAKSCRLSVVNGELVGAGCPRGKEFAEMHGLIDEV